MWISQHLPNTAHTEPDLCSFEGHFHLYLDRRVIFVPMSSLVLVSRLDWSIKTDLLLILSTWDQLCQRLFYIHSSVVNTSSVSRSPVALVGHLQVCVCWVGEITPFVRCHSFTFPNSLTTSRSMLIINIFVEILGTTCCIHESTFSSLAKILTTLTLHFESSLWLPDEFFGDCDPGET